MTVRINLNATDPAQPLLSFDDPESGASGLVNLSKATRLVIDMAPGRTVPVLVIEVPFEGSLDVPIGRVVERVASPGSFLSEARDFFDRLDPATIEAAMLEQSEGLDGKSMGQCVLDVFKEMVRERGNDSRT